MKRYPSWHGGADTGPGRCIQLLERSSPRAGIVLDIGCGRAPLANRVHELGLGYVGVDVDADALGEVEARGFETHLVDLNGSEDKLASRIREIVGERAISAVLAVDVLEHLVEPDAVLRALRGLGGDGATWSLIASVPNVTHVDIASKLLLGRWDLTEFGLLDDTHLRFFSDRLLAELFRSTGWRELDRADVISPSSDQLFPFDAPLVRPGAPAHELLRHLSARAHHHWATYQFVRRFLPTEVTGAGAHRWAVVREADEERVFASVLVRASDASGAALGRLVEDLEAQSSQDFETIVLAPAAKESPRSGNPPLRIVEAQPGVESWNSGLAAARGRWACFIDETVRVSSRWIEAFESAPEAAGRVLKANVVAVPARRLDADKGDSIVGSGKPLAVNPLDPLVPYRPGPTVLPAYAVPIEAARTAGVQFEPEDGAASAAVFLTRAAELCGVMSVDGETVAVSKQAIREADFDPASVARAMDSAPMILPPGSATRIVKLQRLRWRMMGPLIRAKRMAWRLKRLLKRPARPTFAPRS